MRAPALHNAEAALLSLASFLRTPVVDDRDRAGVIQAFEFTFETVWKLFKQIAEREGLTAESPRRALLAAYKLGLIKDEALWLEMLQDRNLISHTYHHPVAVRIFNAVQARYLAALTDAVRLAGAALSDT